MTTAKHPNSRKTGPSPAGGGERAADWPDGRPGTCCGVHGREEGVRHRVVTTESDALSTALYVRVDDRLRTP